MRRGLALWLGLFGSSGCGKIFPALPPHLGAKAQSKRPTYRSGEPLRHPQIQSFSRGVPLRRRKSNVTSFFLQPVLPRILCAEVASSDNLKGAAGAEAGLCELRSRALNQLPFFKKRFRFIRATI
jgi:hypothetical protein